MMTDATPLASPRAGGRSLQDLRDAHSALLREYQKESSHPDTLAEIRRFLTDWPQVGRVLDLNEDRWAAQSILDYWCTVLIRHDLGQGSAVLEDFDEAALVATAEAAFTALSPDEQRAATMVLGMAVRPAGSTSIDYPRLCASDLDAAFVGDDREHARRAIESLVAANVFADLGEGCARFAMDALSRHWPRLQDVIEEARVARRRRLTFGSDAQTWSAGNRQNHELLLKGARLAEAATYTDLTADERAFLDASMRADEDEKERRARLAEEKAAAEAARAEAERREAEVERRERKRVTRLAAGLLAALVAALVFLIVAAALAVFAYRQSQLARSREFAVQAIALAPEHPDTALRAGIASARAADTLEGRSALLTLQQRVSPELDAYLGGHRDQAWTGAFDSDGRKLFTAGLDGAVQVWDLAKKARAAGLAVERGGVYAIALTRDGKRLISSSSRGALDVWDAAVPTPTQLSTASLPGAIMSIALSPDEQWIAATTLTGTVHLVNAADLARGIAPRGAALRVAPGTVWQAAFSPDGKWLATASKENAQNLRIWDLASVLAQTAPGGIAMPTAPLTASHAFTYGDNVLSVAFSPDGKLFAAGTNGGSVGLYDAATMTRIASRSAVHGSQVWGLIFSPDSKRLYSGGGDGLIRVWDIAPESGENALRLLKELKGHSDTVLRLALDPAGRQLVSGDTGGMVLLWDVAAPTALAAGAGPLRLLEFQSRPTTPGDATLAVTDSAGKRQFWRVIDRSPLAGPPPGAVSAALPAPLAVGVSCRATNANATCIQSRILLSDTNGNAYGKPIIANGDVTAAAVSPDGKLLVTGNARGRVRIWDALNQTSITEDLVGAHSVDVRAIAFSPDGSLMATGSDGKNIVLWDLKAHRRLGDAFELPIDGTTALAFSPDGRVLASARKDGVVHLWSVLGTGELIQRACAMTPRGISPEERRDYLFDDASAGSCP